MFLFFVLSLSVNFHRKEVIVITARPRHLFNTQTVQYSSVSPERRRFVLFSEFKLKIAQTKQQNYKVL